MIYYFVFVFGLAIGSFLNVLIWRLNTGEGLWGRSHCPHCHQLIAWYDNIPLLSFLILRGRCRQCGARISFQYPLVELASGVLFMLAFYHNFQFPISNFQTNLNFQISNLIQANSYQLTAMSLFRDWFLIAVMVVIFVIDLRWYLILDIVSLPAAAVILILNLLVGNAGYNLCLPENLWSCNPLSWTGLLLSGIIGGGFFLGQFLVSRGRWIGGGDIRLGLLIGLALGWPYVLVAIILAYFAGSIVGLALLAAGRKDWGSKLPFGAFLAPASIATLFWGPALLAWYIGLFR